MGENVSGEDAEGLELEEAFGAGVDVGEGGVGFGEGLVEELEVELGEGGPLVAVGAGDGAETGSGLHGADLFFAVEEVGAICAEEFCAEDIGIEFHVVRDEGGGGLAGGGELVEGGGKGDTIGQGALGGDAVDAGGVRGDGVAVGADEEFVGGDGRALGIGEEEGELDDAGPVGQIGDGGFTAEGDAGGFGVEE